ncbi:DUF930 domain-containing protein [Phyllobacterium sp. 21LDTY02-6]|uniref:DUF930 domain-containing protein n=1 Tax=Phyllobacterium sp. 21LDTY02-6 TaxID=2944903 RepID=UPI0020206313|nr:DUF930 domain-containing protein [Phyllobacterium sp. 21LDTY02-6]MCO4319262.1 DUF930 domain-containing protein [Phyllobacterium sp. 21LDTY02-6]
MRHSIVIVTSGIDAAMRPDGPSIQESISQPMFHAARRHGWFWSVPVSLAIHGLIAAFFLFDITAALPKMKEDKAIEVRLVPPPAPKPPPKQPPKQPKPPEPPKKVPAMEAAAPPKSPDQAKPQPAPASPAPAPPDAGQQRREREPQKLPVERREGKLASADQAEPKAKDAPARKAEKATPKRAGGERQSSKAKKGSSRLQKATRLYSPNSISDPRIRDALAKLPPRRRIIQLCSIEALEQIRHQRPASFPDLFVPFEPGGGRLSDQALDATGGAFRSRTSWFSVDYRCGVNGDQTEVVSFSLSFGDLIPPGEWSARRLPLN